MKNLILFVSMLLSIGGYAQFKVTGRVLDNTRQPLPGTGVVIKGTTTGTLADADGSFSIDVPNENATLSVSFIGFVTQEVKASKNFMELVMAPDAMMIDETVVIGYGTVRKSDLTGSVSGVSSKTIMERVSTNPLGALQGRVAGFTINNNSGTPGGTFKASIRGFNSINATNNPLFVVDGIIGADFGMLNPADIESIDVLKDASSTAIYGSRGANGVIIVTTKKGKSGEPRVSYVGSIGLAYFPQDRKIDVLNSAEYLQMEKQAWSFVPGRKMPDFATLEPDLFNPDGTPKYNTDWQKEATRAGLQTNHSLSIAGGSDRTTSIFSLGYDNNQGILLETYYKKYTARVGNTFKVNDWFKTETSASLMHTDRNDPTEGAGSLNAPRMMLEALPIIPVYNTDGSFGTNAQHAGTEGGENPVNLLKNMINRYQRTVGLADFTVTLSLAKNLDFKSSVSTQLTWEKNDRYSGRKLSAIARDEGGRASVKTERQIYLQNENYLTYNNVFNKIHRVNAMAGASWTSNNMENAQANAENFTDDFYKYNNLGVAANPRPGSSDWDEWRMNSYFGRVNYTLMDKYLFTLTTRVDGSSRFGKNNQYALFPSAAFAWRLSEESFMKDVTAISNLKFRLSYGSTGNDAIPNFRSISSTGTYTAIFDGARYAGVGRGRVANPDLKWERTNQFNTGLDFSIIKNRLTISVDYYYKKTIDLLLDAPLAASSGYTSYMRNIGNMGNKGWELTVGSKLISREDFSWNMDVLLSSNRNKILKLGDKNEDIMMGPYFLDATNILRVGESVNSFYGYVRTGTWGTQEAAEAAKYDRKPGDLKFADLNNDHVIDAADRQIIGNGLPKMEGTLTSNMRYKNFDFSFDISFKSGNDVLRLDYSTLEDRQTLGNSFKSVLDAWTVNNQNTDIAAVRVDSKGDGSELKLNSHYIENGSFIRGSNLVLGYSLNDAVSQRLKIQKLRFFVNFQNFFLITKYKGYDPETTNYGDNFAQGVEFMNYPKARMVNVGLNLTF